MDPILVKMLSGVVLVIFLVAGALTVVSILRNRREAERKNNSASVSLANDTPVIEMTLEKELEDQKPVSVDVESGPEEEIEIEVNADIGEEGEDESDVEDPAAVIEAFFDGEGDEEEDKEEAVCESDESMPAYAARAYIAVSSPPLFKVAPPSQQNEIEEPPVPVPTKSDAKDIEPESAAAKDEVIEKEQKSLVEAEAQLPAGPVRDFSFDEVPTEEPEFEESLSEEVTNRIQELDSELNSIELLVSEIERDMAGFEPLGGIEMEDEEDESSFAEETSVAA